MTSQDSTPHIGRAGNKWRERPLNDYDGFLSVHEFGLRPNSNSGRKMPQELQIVVSEGEIRFIHQDDLAEAFQAGRAITRRASNVEPGKGGWNADLGPVNGPVLGPFNRRDTALQAEDNWLRQHLTPVPKE